MGLVKPFAYHLRDTRATRPREDGAEVTAAHDGHLGRMEVVPPDNTLTHANDPRGNLTGAADGDSQVTFNHDERERLAPTATDGTAGPQPEVTLTCAEDALGRRLTMSDRLGNSLTSPSGRASEYEHYHSMPEVLGLFEDAETAPVPAEIRAPGQSAGKPVRTVSLAGIAQKCDRSRKFA